MDWQYIFLVKVKGKWGVEKENIRRQKVNELGENVEIHRA